MSRVARYSVARSRASEAVGNEHSVSGLGRVASGMRRTKKNRIERVARVGGSSVQKERCFRGKEGVEGALLLRVTKTLKNANKSEKGAFPVKSGSREERF